jgi:hypothetical protein
MTMTNGEIGKKSPKKHVNRAKGFPPNALSHDFNSRITMPNENDVKPSNDGTECEQSEETEPVTRGLGSE